MTKSPQRRIMLEIEGRFVSVPADESTVYFAEVYRPHPYPFPSRIHVTPDQEAAWDFIRKTLQSGDRGHVLQYDISKAETEAPVRVGCLGRLDNINGQIIPHQPDPAPLNAWSSSCSSSPEVSRG